MEKVAELEASVSVITVKSIELLFPPSYYPTHSK